MEYVAKTIQNIPQDGNQVLGMGPQKQTAAPIKVLRNQEEIDVCRKSLGHTHDP